MRHPIILVVHVVDVILRTKIMHALPYLPKYEVERFAVLSLLRSHLPLSVYHLPRKMSHFCNIEMIVIRIWNCFGVGFLLVVFKYIYLSVCQLNFCHSCC